MRRRAGSPTASGILNWVTPCASWLAGTFTGLFLVRQVSLPLGVFPGTRVGRTAAPTDLGWAQPADPSAGRALPNHWGQTKSEQRQTRCGQGCASPGLFSRYAICPLRPLPRCAYASDGRHRAPVAGGAPNPREYRIRPRRHVAALGAHHGSLFPGTVLAATERRRRGDAKPSGISNPARPSASRPGCASATAPSRRARCPRPRSHLPRRESAAVGRAPGSGTVLVATEWTCRREGPPKPSRTSNPVTEGGSWLVRVHP